MLKQLWKGSAPLTVTGILMVPVLIGAIVGLIVDPRMITGAPAWLKPAKFAASFVIYTLTLAWIFTLIPEWVRTRRLVGWTTAVVLVLEMAIIGAQAFRGTTSHFNVSTPLDTTLFAIMGAAILAQTVSTIAVAVASWRHRFADAALGWALRFGIVITIAGALTGGLMTRPTAEQLSAARAGVRMTIAGAHTVGARDGGPGLAVTGWSSEHGDMRVPHFVGLHAMQVLPLVAVLLARWRLRDDARVRLTLTTAFGYAALFGILLSQALRGHAVLAPDGATIALLVAVGIGMLAGAATSVLRIPAARPNAFA